MKPIVPQFKSTLERMCNNTYSREDVNTTVTYARKISYYYLLYLDRRQYKDVTGISWNIHFLKKYRKNIHNIHKKVRKKRYYHKLVQDVAIDCISSLFQRDEKGSFTRINVWLKPVLNNDNTINEQQLRHYFKKIVRKETKQELSSIFAERDPIGARVIRSMRSIAIFHKNVWLFRKYSRLYLCKLQKEHDKTSRNSNIKMFTQGLRDELCLEKEEIPFTQLIHSVYQRCDQKMKPHQIIKIALDIVTQTNQYRKCVSSTNLIRLVKAIALEEAIEYIVLIPGNLGMPDDSLLEDEIQNATSETVKMIHEKINNYVEKGKIARELEPYYKLVAHEIVYTQLEGDAPRYSKITRRIMNIPPAIYYNSDYKIHIDYLGKVSIEYLKKQLKELV